MSNVNKSHDISLPAIRVGARDAVSVKVAGIGADALAILGEHRRAIDIPMVMIVAAFERRGNEADAMRAIKLEPATARRLADWLRATADRVEDRGGDELRQMGGPRCAAEDLEASALVAPTAEVDDPPSPPPVANRTERVRKVLTAEWMTPGEIARCAGIDGKAACPILSWLAATRCAEKQGQGRGKVRYRRNPAA